MICGVITRRLLRGSWDGHLDRGDCDYWLRSNSCCFIFFVGGQMLTTILWLMGGSILVGVLLIVVVRVFDMFIGIDDEHN